MAVYSPSDYSIQESDEVQEMFCEHCNTHDNKYVPAEGFCEDCVEYMCDVCLKYHKRYSASHTLKDKDSMPQDFCLEKCSSHKNEIEKFYCQICEKLACSVCRTKDHKNCKAVRHLPTLVKGIEKSKDLKDLTESIDELLVQVEQTEEQVETNIERVISQETGVLSCMTKKKEEILSAYRIHQKGIIDQFEKKMEETIARLREEKKELIENSQEKQRRLQKSLTDEEIEIQKKVRNTSADDQKVLQSIKAKTSTMKTYLKTLSFNLEQYQNTKQRCKLFVAMKTSKENTEKLEHNLTQMKDNNDIYYYTVDSEIPGLKDIEQSKIFFSFKKVQNSELKRTACFHSAIEVEEMNWTSLYLLSENTFLVISSGFHIIIKNIKEPSVCSKIIMYLPITAAVKIDEKQLALTFLKHDIICLLKLRKDMTEAEKRYIKAPAQCQGIAYRNDTLIVSTESGNIHILDMSGTVLKTFNKDSDGPKMCSHSLPFPLAVNQDNTIIYVADVERDTITSMTLDGKVNAIYKDDMFSSPTQLTVHKSGAVFVCWMGSGIVQQLSSDLNPVKILLDKKEMNRTCSVALCNKTDRLYLGMFSGKIDVYELSIEKD